MRKHIADTNLVAGCVQEAISQYTAVVESLRSYNDWLWLASAYEGLSCAAIAMNVNEPLLQSEFINGLNWKNSPRMNRRTHHNPNKATLSGRLSPASVTKKLIQEEDEHAKCGDLGASIEEPINVSEQEEEEILEDGTQNGYGNEEDEMEPEDSTDFVMHRFAQKDFVVDKFTKALHYYGKVLRLLL